MRDPDLVQRAERAATALERAWSHWRVRHGLGSGPPPPVSSYVGYSLEEPWGQPRVVLGVEAEEAERLAAILEGHDCVGPVHAEMNGRSEWRQPAEAAAAAPGWTVPDAELDMQVRPPQHAASGQPAVAPAGSTPPDGAAGSQPAEPVSGPAPEYAMTAQEDLTAEQPVLPAALRQAAAMADLPAELPDGTAAHLGELAARSSGRPPMSQAFPAVPVTPAAGYGLAASPVEPLAAGQPGIVALRTRPGTPAEQAEAARPAVADGAAASQDQQPAEPVGRARLLPVSRLNRTRKPAAGPDAAPWPAAGKSQPAATDTAV